MLNDHEPLTGTATCACTQHHATVRGDTDPRTDLEFRAIDLSFWERPGRTFSLAERASRAWSWLKGEPQPFTGMLLDRREASRLLDAIRTAYAVTWEE